MERDATTASSLEAEQDSGKDYKDKKKQKRSKTDKKRKRQEKSEETAKDQSRINPTQQERQSKPKMKSKDQL
ncbi:hypothetical protein Tco_1566195 [Tanacetum coccineum]